MKVLQKRIVQTFDQVERILHELPTADIDLNAQEVHMTVETDPHVEENLYTRYRTLATRYRETRTKIERLKDHRAFISCGRFSHLLSENEKLLADLSARLAPLTARVEAVLRSRKLEAQSVQAQLAPVEREIQEARVLHKINLISWRQLHGEIKKFKGQRNRLLKALKAKRREIRQIQNLLDLRAPGQAKKAPRSLGCLWHPRPGAALITPDADRLQELKAEVQALRGVLERLRNEKKKAADRPAPTRRETATVERLLAAVQNGDMRALTTMFPASAGITVCVRQP
jgi:small-conductance mechanosensitive channel